MLAGDDAVFAALFALGIERDFGGVYFIEGYDQLQAFCEQCQHFLAHLSFLLRNAGSRGNYGNTGLEFTMSDFCMETIIQSAFSNVTGETVCPARREAIAR